MEPQEFIDKWLGWAKNKEEINDEILADLDAMNQALRIHDVVELSKQLPTDENEMRIYQLRTAKDFYNSIKGNHSIEEVMRMYAEDVAKRFAAECVNEALGNKMEVSNALHHAIEGKYRSIIWEEGQ